jgi:hypothetical protein
MTLFSCQLNFFFRVVVWGPMRRWMEFGWDGDFANPKFELNSNRLKRGPRPQGIGDLPPIWLSMPYKETLLNILQGTSLKDFPQFSSFTARITSGGSTDAPLTDAAAHESCTAEHVVNGSNTYGWRIDQFFTGGFWQMLIGGFPMPGGGFTSQMLNINVDGPPSENG